MTVRRIAKILRRRCVLCGSAGDVELHHVGGRNHVFWFLVPLCREHHVKLTALIYQAGIDMRFTTDVIERISRARRAVVVFLWMLDEWQTNYLKGEAK